jgi:hypothetical protein
MSADQVLSGFHLLSCSVKPMPPFHYKRLIQTSISVRSSYLLGKIFDGLDTLISYNIVTLFDIPYDSIDWGSD